MRLPERRNVATSRVRTNTRRDRRALRGLARENPAHPVVQELVARVAKRRPANVYQLRRSLGNGEAWQMVQALLPSHSPRR
jgi:hypothetical protein